MKLMTRQIRTSLKNCHSDMQLTLEDDINVPDSKPDIEHIIKIQGRSMYKKPQLRQIVPSFAVN